MNRAVIGAVALTLTIGCTARAGRDGVDDGERSAPSAELTVPDRPPWEWLIPEDSVAVLLARENQVFEHPRMSGPYPRDVVMVEFARGSSLAERAEAVRRVGGSLVAGDGAYHYVRVRLQCPGDVPVWCAIDRLAPLPHVGSAAPMILGFGPLRDR